MANNKAEKDDWQSVPVDDWQDVSAKPQSPIAQAGRGLLSALGSVGRAIDSYTGAPMRAAIGAAQDAESPAAMRRLGGQLIERVNEEKRAQGKKEIGS